MTKKKLNASQQKLAADNVRLAAHLAHSVWNRNRKVMELEEVVAVANIGLVIAAQRWNPEGRQINPEDLANGKAFAGFARRHIMGNILDWQRRQDHVQRNVRTEYKLLEASGLTDGIKYEELALRTGIDEERIKRVVFAVSHPPVNLEIPSDNDESDTFEMDLPHKTTVEQEVSERAILDTLVKSVKELTNFQRIVLVLRYYSGLYLTNIAEELNTPIAEVSKAHETAVLTILNNIEESVSNG